MQDFERIEKRPEPEGNDSFFKKRNTKDLEGEQSFVVNGLEVSQSCSSSITRE